MERLIIWNKQPSVRLKKELKRISEESYSQAELVEKAILSSLDEVVRNPEKYPKDKYKGKNDGSFRAFETHSYRLSYRIKANEIRVLRIRHIKQMPKHY